MNQHLRLKIIGGIFSLLAIFSFAPEAKAMTCAWASSCGSPAADSLCISTTKPNTTSVCCCVWPDTLANSNCSWLADRLGQVCGADENMTVANDVSCGGEKLFAENKCCCPKTAATTTKPAAVLNNPFDNLNIDIPGLYKSISCKKNADGSYTCPKVTCTTDNDGSSTCEVPWIAQYIIAIYNYALIIIGSLAAVTIMAGGVIWLISGSNATRMKTAKEMIIGSVSGLVVMFSSYMIISVINPDILIFKPLTISYIPELMPDFSGDVPSSNDNPYQAGCDEFKNNNGSTAKCEQLASQVSVNLVTYQGKQVSPTVKSKLEQAFACVEAKNGKNVFYINGGARTVETSLRLWKAFQSGKGNTAAKPCCSNHMGGNAVDISRSGGSMSWAYNKSSGLTECMEKNGLYARIGNEPWHWSRTGY